MADIKKLQAEAKIYYVNKLHEERHVNGLTAIYGIDKGTSLDV
jgi:hypothetical protein